ncbi:C40 family peptidase [Streptomyces sp. NPDC005576]|uniref:C40 family peptidase n=1 Tax=unclassified Streptomyces TaxID=2593676 RepID=UPI0033DD66B6
MSLTVHIPSHRKPRQRSSRTALRAGVAGGVLSTIAVAGAAGPAQAEPVTQTIEMPTITAGLSTAVAASAQATQQVALDLETRASEDAAAENAAKAATKAKAEAVRKAEAKKKAEAAAKAEAKAKAEAAERASRSAARTTLSASSGSSTTATTLSATSSSSASSSASVSSSSSVSGSAAAVVAFAKAQIGDAYVSGGTGPNSWDCSGLVQAAYASVGVSLPRVSQDQSVAGTQVSLSNLQAGDILYWGGAGSAYHVAIYVGDGQFVGAQNSSTGTVQRDLSYDQPTGAVRVL